MYLDRDVQLSLSRILPSLRSDGRVHGLEESGHGAVEIPRGDSLNRVLPEPLPKGIGLNESPECTDKRVAVSRWNDATVLAIDHKISGGADLV